jgi:hypothetical protein
MVLAENSIMFYSAFKKAGMPAKMQIFLQGGTVSA